jgi:hypothetical protein
MRETIEVFQTNVQEVSQAEKIIALLLQHFPKSKINFDLEDCDKVLRIEGNNFMAEQIVTLVNENGFACKVME